MTWQNRIIRSENVDPTSLTPNPKNWRKHPKFQAEAMNGVLDDVGWIQDVIVNERTGNLIDGHLRLELARKNKESTIPVKYVDLTVEEEEKALATFDPIGAMAEADATMLNALIERCQTDNEEVKGLLVDIAEKEKLDFGKKEAKEDDFEPPIEVETTIKRGDIIQLGRHRVMCGDSTSAEDFGRLMNGKKADMAFTDPPYNINYSGIKREHKKIENDNITEDDFKHFLIKSLKYIPITSYVCCNWMTYDVFKQVLKEIKRPVKSCIVWDKETPVQHLDKYFKQHEFILYTGKLGGEKTLRGDVWKVRRGKSDSHPTMKPVELVAMAISDNQSMQIVVDPFLGSGTTLIACEQLDRTCYGMEISPQYCEVICMRWEKLTGGTRVMA